MYAFCTLHMQTYQIMCAATEEKNDDDFLSNYSYTVFLAYLFVATIYIL